MDANSIVSFSSFLSDLTSSLEEKGGLVSPSITEVESREVRQNWLNFAYPENYKTSKIKCQPHHLSDGGEWVDTTIFKFLTAQMLRASKY